MRRCLPSSRPDPADYAPLSLLHRVLSPTGPTNQSATAGHHPPTKCLAVYAPTAHLDAANTLYRTLHVAGRVCTVFGGVTRMFDTGHRVHSAHSSHCGHLPVHTHRQSAHARHRPTRRMKHVQHAQTSATATHKRGQDGARVSRRIRHTRSDARAHTRRCAYIRRASSHCCP